MEKLHTNIISWLEKVLNTNFKTTKHSYSNQDDVYKVSTADQTYYLKISSSLKAEYDNLNTLKPLLHTPRVVAFESINNRDCLLLSELQGKNLAELVGEKSNDELVKIFADAVREFHRADIKTIFPSATKTEVLLHGDMAMPNVIISKDNKVGFIDVGQLSFGHPEKDLADAIWSLQRNMGPDYGKKFLEYYGRVEMTPVIKKALAFRYKPTSSED